MRKAFTLLLLSVITTLGATAKTTKVAEFNFQRPETIMPSGYAPDIPENGDDRNSMYEVNITDVPFTADGVTLTASGGLHNEGQIPPNNYVWRKGYDDNYSKLPTGSTDGTYYLNLRMSNLDDEVAADPSQKHLLSVKAPQGAAITKIVVYGLGTANAAQYIQLVDADCGTYTIDNSAERANTFIPAEGKNLNEVQFTCPRKRADGVNLSGYLLPRMEVIYEIDDEAPVVKTTKVVEFNFQKPETITPAGYAPEVPENGDDRNSMYEVNITDVPFTADGVTLTASGGLHNEGQIPPNNYVWRKGYDDNYSKLPTGSTDGTYYLNLRMSNLDDEVAADPSQKHLLSVKAPEGATITKIVVYGLGTANAAQYIQLVDADCGTYTIDNSAERANTFIPAEGKNLNEVQFTCPRKRADGVNLSGYLLPRMEVTYEMAATTEPEPDPEPTGEAIPYNRTFKDLEAMTVIDANKDGYTWEAYLSKARCTGPIGESNPNIEADDWLITPGLAMYSGKYYKVYTPLLTQYGSPGRAEIKFGNAPTPEAMTETLMEAVSFDSRQDYINYIKLPSTGTWYLGVHSLTQRDGALYTQLQSIDIYEPMEASAPGAISNLIVTPTSDGTKPYKVTITFNAPSVDMDGNPLTENLDKVVVGYGTYVGNALGTIGQTFTDVTPGQELSYTYSQNSNGYKSFGIVAYNASGIGRESYIDRVFIGVNKPGDPTDLKVVETETPGTVILSWKAPETDTDGNPINQELIRYNLTDCESYQPIAKGISGTSYVYNTGLINDQKFFRFAIVAETDGGSTLSQISPATAVGKPIETPIIEGFDRISAMPLLFSSIAGSTAAIIHEGDMSGAKKPYSAEGDGCFVSLYATSADVHPTMLTSKISLSELSSPVLSVDVFAPVAANNQRVFPNNELVVKTIIPGSEPTELGKVRIGDLIEDGWNRITFPLSDFIGKDVQFLFEGNLVDYPNGEDSQSFVFFDRMQIREPHQGHDLAAIYLELPVVAEQSHPFGVTTYIENEGAIEVENACVFLYRNNEKIEAIDLPLLIPGHIEQVTFLQTLSACDPTEVNYHAVIVSQADDKDDNNTTAEKALNYKASIHPTPEALFGEELNGNVVLNWSEPLNLGGTASEYTEDFEIDQTLAIDNLEGWTFYDLDMGTLGLPNGMTIDGLEEGKTQYAWLIADESIFNATDMAYSGSHFMTGFFNYDGRTNNDVAVSPELNGEAQTISFYAISLASRYPESLDIWYSTKSRDLNDFQSLGRIDYVGTSWTKYNFDLPEGTRFFAIRHISADAWIVGIDDVTFIPMEPGKDVTLIGYNVYRNGERLNKSLVAEPTFVDETAAKGSYTYSVSAVYDKGESSACSPIGLTVTSLNSVTASSLKVVGQTGYIMFTVTDATDAAIYTPAGVKITDVYCEPGTTRLPLSAGLYLVNTSKGTHKVIVK